MRFLLTFVALIGCLQLVLSQENSTELDQLRQRAESFYFTNPDSTRIYADSIYRLAQASENETYMGEGKRLEGVFYQLKAESGTAKSLFQEAADHFEMAGDSTRFGRALMSIGLMDISLGNYQDALALLFRSKEIAEAQGVEQHVLRAIAEIGRVYSIQGEHDKALPEFRFYYSKVKNSEDLRQLATALNYLSVEFMQIHDHDSSLFYLNKNLEVQKKLRYPVGIAAALQNIASVYLEMGDSDKALTNFNDSYQYYRTANFGQGIGQVKLNIASIYMSQRRFGDAARNLEEAVQNSTLINDYHALRAQYSLLSAAYDSLGRKKAALDSYRKFHAMSDTLLNIDKQRAISELFTQYETKEKEQQIELQQSQIGEQEAKLQRNQLLIFALVVLGLLLLVIILLVRNRAKKKQALIRKESELKLREAEINAVINSQEKERNRFARDLHDGFGQMISVLKLNLSQLGKTSTKDVEKRTEVFQNGEAIINDMYAELRNICFDLMPQTLVKNGLIPALKEFGARINQSGIVSCDVMTFEETMRFSEIEEISLFRITQEWVNNVLKYANASHITIQLTQDGSEVTLSIEDDGMGFNPEDFYNGKGNGWKNIQTRLKQVSGVFDLDTRPGRKENMVTINAVVTGSEIPAGTDALMSDTRDTIPTS